MAHLGQTLDNNRSLFKLANAIDRPEFEQAFGKLNDPGQDRPAQPIHLMVGLHYLKHAYDLYDQDVVILNLLRTIWAVSLKL